MSRAFKNRTLLFERRPVHLKYFNRSKMRFAIFDFRAKHAILAKICPTAETARRPYDLSVELGYHSYFTCNAALSGCEERMKMVNKLASCSFV